MEQVASESFAQKKLYKVLQNVRSWPSNTDRYSQIRSQPKIGEGILRRAT